MKLDSEKKVLLCQKALYAKQLVHYRELCATYKELATIAVHRYQMQDTPEASIADQLQDYYGPYLTKASKGDLSFLAHNGTTERGFLTAKFDPDQINLFKKYAKAAERVATFQEASSRLHDATYHNNNFDVSPELLEEYHEFMQGDKETQSFDTFISENSKRWIGHISYRRAQNELSKIRDIDANHVSVLSGRSLSPKSFGATITGYRGKVRSEKARMQNELDRDLSEKDIENFSQPISNSEKIGATAYVLGHRTTEAAKEFYYAHQETLKKALQRAALIGLAVGAVTLGSKGVEAVLKAHEFNSDVYMNNPAYESTVNNNTVEMMENVDEFLTSLETSSSIPTAEQLRQATEMVDNEGNVIMDNLIRNSFENQFENLTIPEGGVVIHYNKNHDNMSDGSLGNYVYITCTDSNGKEYRYTIKDFSSQGENRIKRLFEDERDIDEQAKDIDDAFTDDFTMNSKNVKAYLAALREIHNNNVELAGTVIIINNPQIDYDNAKATDSETLGDKLKLDVVNLFCINPNLKTVAPDKVEKQPVVEIIETTTPTTEHTTETDDRDDR